MFVLRVDADAVVKFTSKLEQMNRSAFPVAVRTALNSAAFDVKQRTMPLEAGKAFVQRSKNFFKANSRVEMAKGFAINNMQSEVGFVSKSLKGANNFAVKDLEQQEHGGKIRGRSFIPMDPARGGNKKKLVKQRFRLGILKNLVDANKTKTLNKKQKFIRAAIVAKKLYGNDAFVLGNSWGGGNRTLSRIDDISSNLKTQKLEIRRTPVYTFKKGRSINISSTSFMKRASMESGANIERYYVMAAIRQFKKLQHA